MRLGDVEEDVDIRGTITGGEAGEEGSVEILFQKRVRDVGGSRHRWFFLGCASIAKDGKGERVVEVHVSARASNTSGTRCADPVVSHGLVSSHNGGVSLGDEDIELVNDEWLALDTVSFDDSHVVAIDREAVEGTASNVDDTEPVTFARFNVDDRERNLGAALETTDTVDQNRIRDGDDSGLEVYLLQKGSLLVVVIGKSDDSAWIINVVHIRKRVVGIVDDQSTTKTVAILGSMVRMIPESAGLLVQRERVKESGVGGNGTLTPSMSTDDPRYE